MLSVKTFIGGMSMLKKVYIGWEFDIEDKMQVELWYSSFKNLTDERFNELIKDYITQNEYPPKSIKSLTDIYVNRQVRYAKIQPEKALDTVRDIVSNCGGWEYGGKTDIYAKLKRYPELYETVKEFEDTIRNMASGDTYTADRFRKAYEQKLREHASSNVNKFLGLSFSDPNVLGSAALPYEI